MDFLVVMWYREFAKSFITEKETQSKSTNQTYHVNYEFTYKVLVEFNLKFFYCYLKMP